jgi:hypothetical protein
MADKDIEALLREAVSAHRALPGKIEVGKAIYGLTGKNVIRLTDDPLDSELLEKVCQAAKTIIKDSAVIPIRTTRLNELGNAVEEPLLNACLKVGLDATWPKRSDGSGGRSGYPDIALGIGSQRPTYLEAKVVGDKNDKSSFRSFYLSPSDRPKVCVDARHLLLAFGHKRLKDTEDGLEQYSLLTYKVVDLARVSGKIKFEFQSSNKDMYLGHAVIAAG